MRVYQGDQGRDGATIEAPLAVFHADRGAYRPTDTGATQWGHPGFEPGTASLSQVD